MGIILSLFAKSKELETTTGALLLAPSVEGDQDKVKTLIGRFLATGTDPKLQEFVNRTDPAGNAAIHGAVFGSHFELVKYLIEDCGASLTMENNLGCSPLWLAAGYNHIETLNYLLDRLPDPKGSLLQSNKSGDTPLLAAASRGNVESCRILLEHAETHAIQEEMLQAKNKSGDTPFSVAIFGEHGEGPLFDMLLYDNSAMNQSNLKGMSSFFIVCERNWVTVFDKMVEKDASLDTCDDKGSTPLCIAAFCGCEEMVQRILQVQPGLLNVPNSACCTPLWLASRTGNASMTKILLGAGADASIADNNGLTPHAAAIKYKKAAVDAVFYERNNNNNKQPVAQN